MFIRGFERNKEPMIIEMDDFKKVKLDEMEDKARKSFLHWFKRFKKNEVTYSVEEYGETCHWELTNHT
jgi:hypothetical protein